MKTDLMQLIKSFAGLKVLVIGEAMLDSYLEGKPGRLCREAPVPIVDLQERKDAPGGAANTAVNIRTLGGQAKFLSVIGDDWEGRLLRDSLEAKGVPTEDLLVQPGRQTLAKHRVIANGQILVRYDQGSTGPVNEATEQKLIERLNQLFPHCEAVIISDYGYGILTPKVVQTLANLQAVRPRVLVADSKNLAAYRHIGVTAVKPNFEETLKLLGVGEMQGTRAEKMLAQGEKVLDITGAKIAAVTLDTEGSLVFERGSAPYRTYAKPTSHSRAAGAGDTFVSAMTLALAAGANTPTAAELASGAAAVVVSKEGTATCSGFELQEHFSGGQKHIQSWERLAARLAYYREQGKRIVFTNGFFDLLHRGHVTYLSRAKALGDVLIVGVNSDAGVRRLKGPSRPINPLEDRIQVLAALSCVDHLVTFDEDTPVELIKAIRPEIFVKGGDYTRETLPEAALVEELGGTIQLLPFLYDRSTSTIIERIREDYALPLDESSLSNVQNSKAGNGKADGNQDEALEPETLDFGRLANEESSDTKLFIRE